MTRLRHAALLLVMVLAACASPRSFQDIYVPFGPNPYGYAEQPAGERRFQVSYVAPLQTGFSFARQETDAGMARAFDLALLRAAEVTGANGSPAFRVVDRVNDVNTRDYPSYRDPYWYSGWGWRRPYSPYAAPYGGFYGPAYDNSYATLAVRVTVTIELLPAVESGAYDAKNVQATIRGRYAMPQS